MLRSRADVGDDRGAAMERDEHPQGEPRTLSVEAPRTISGRFVLERPLNRFRSVDTWFGRDLTTDRPVAVRLADAALLSASARRGLARDAPGLSDLHTSTVARLILTDVDDRTWFAAREWAHGLPLAERIRAGPIDVDTTLAIARDALAGLAALHERQLLHRGVTPSNLVLDLAPSPPRATLTDAGLSRAVLLEASVGTLSPDRLRYMSPEQSGLLAEPESAASDLYALGAILYECLAGRPAFPGDEIAEVLRAHVAARPPLLEQLGVWVPRALDEALARLLWKDPRDRYQTARGALEDFAAIAEARQRGRPDPSLVVGLKDRRGTLTEPAFVDREAELAALDAELDRAARGVGRLLLVEAESGGGKSRLLDQWARDSVRRNARVVRGQGVSRAAQLPYQTFKGVARDLEAAARTDPAFVEALRQRLDLQLAPLCSTLPELRELCGPAAPAGPQPTAFGPPRILRALVALLDALGTRERPGVVILDDCQWADDATLRLLESWASQPALGQVLPRHVVVVAALRPEEIAPDHPLRRIPGAARLQLPPLPGDRLREIAESMAGALPEDAIATTVRLSRGNPFFAVAVVEGMVETGALRAEAGGWQVDRDRLSEVRSASHAAAVLARRLDLVSPAALGFLMAAALLGKELDVALAATLAKQPLALAQAVADEAERRHILWPTRDPARRAFVHDKLREELLGRLPAPDQAALHLRAAEAIEAQDRRRVFDIAYHFDAAGEPRRALAYALEAARQARAQHDLELAERYYRIAERGEPEQGAARRAIVEGLGEVLLLRGRYPEARGRLEEALALAEDDFARASIEGRLGDLAFKEGRVQDSRRALEQALERLGRRVPRRRIALLFALSWQAFVQALHTWLPRLFVGRRRSPPGPRDLLTIRLLRQIQYPYYFGVGFAAVWYAHLRMLNLVERHPPGEDLAAAYAGHAVATSAIPWIERGLRYSKAALVLYERFRDPWGQGTALEFESILLYVAGRYREALEKATEAMKLLDRAGDRWEYNNSLANASYCLLMLGELAQAKEAAERRRQLGRAIGERLADRALEIRARAERGRVPVDLVQEALAIPSDDAQRNQAVLKAEALRLIASGRYDDAVETLERALRLVAQAHLHNIYVADVPTLLARALRLAWAAAPPVPLRRREALHRRARRAIRTGLRSTRAFRSCLAETLREDALLAAAGGRERRARRRLDRSLAIAERLQQRFERAQTLLARGRIGQAVGWPDAGADVAEATRSLRALGVEPAEVEPYPSAAAPPAVAAEEVRPITPSLLARFSALLEEGRHIATALSRGAVFAALRDAALDLLRGESCVLFERQQGDSQAAVGVTPEDEEQRPLVDEVAGQAIAEGRPIARDLPSRPRSVLCAPIFVHGRPAAGFCVYHRELRHLFGEEERRIAELLAAIAGAALENAAGFARIEALSQEQARLYREAQAAIRARDEFLLLASHELRTPLTTLRLQVQTMLRRARARPAELPPEPIGPRLEGIDGQVGRLADLVNTLLDLPAISEGRIEEVPQAVDLLELVRGVADEARDTLRQAGCPVTIEADGPMVGRWPKVRLAQVVRSLLSNAIKYGSGRPIEISLAGGRERVRLGIRDHGIGIPTLDQQRIFEPFERAVPSRQYGGFGLGLWIARQIALALGGEVRVESAPGEGSLFTVELPRGLTEA